ncbi:MAG: phosphoribosyltransferase family protein [Chloroflexota bacterium]
MKDYLRLIDTHTRGPRYDVTPLFADAAAFAALVSDLIAPFDVAEIDFVAGIDALGFILGTAIAIRLGRGFIPIRKGGKLPVQADAMDFVDYTGQSKSLELRAGAVPLGAKILLVDEWIETGAQVKAAAQLIERQGGVLAGIASISIDLNEKTRSLLETYHCHSVWVE